MGDASAMQPLSSKPAFIDLSHALIPNETPACDGHPSYNACCVLSLAKGGIANVHSLTIGTHTGTHIDAPYHFFDDGITVDQLDLSLLTAVPIVVADLRSKKAGEKITWDDLKKHEERLRSGVALLLCTGWSKHWGKPDYSQHPYLDPDVASGLIDMGVRVVGVDAMSPDKVTEEAGDSGHVHRIILGNGGVIVENLRGLEDLFTSGIEEEDMRLSILPLRLGACDGSPVRAVVWSRKVVL
ncbi:hypothetical protein NM688_g3648 [Phlebia brevispora]|uniref:Uncharacterized protein n=1 Tax=Phlebia brevispora TaxID=194682 RepID=A0ACC1T598_9APHY|nr:hypothetical protein NM688_g3648 [Phlebia brevispora]